MAKDYVMPKLAMGMNEGTVNEWLFKDGDYVEQGAPVAVVETEKVSYDVESPHSGYLHILIAEGETVPVETRIGQFAESAEECTALTADSAAAAPSPAPTSSGAESSSPAQQVATTSVSGGRIKASPLAKKMAADVGLDLARVSGTGPGGRIVKRDVLLAQEQGLPAAGALERSGPLLEKLRIPIKGTVRATIAKRLVESLQTTAQLSSTWESDITSLIKVRKGFVARADIGHTGVHECLPDQGHGLRPEASAHSERQHRR